jgi:hypothetical protein
MQTHVEPLKISLSEYETLGWPVKVRVRAKQFPLAPRKSPAFPASLQPRSNVVMRTFELPRRRINRQLPNLPVERLLLALHGMVAT